MGDERGALGLGQLQASPLASPAGSMRSLKPLGLPLPLSRQGSAESLASHVSDRSQKADRKKKEKKEKKAKKEKRDSDGASDNFLRPERSVMRRGSSSDSLGSAVSARSAASDRKKKKEKKHKKEKRDTSPDERGALGLGQLQASPLASPAGSMRSPKPLGLPLPL